MTDDPGWPQIHKVRVSRRQVAAIAFLANIRVENETEEALPGLHCLQGTEVLENYRCVSSAFPYFKLILRHYITAI